MSKDTDILAYKANQTPGNYVAMPENFAVHGFRCRKLPALRLFCTLKAAFRTGRADITPAELLKLSGLKCHSTLEKYLDWLSGCGVVWYKSGLLRLFNPTRYFPSSKRGANVIRIFEADFSQIKNVLLAALSKLADRRNQRNSDRCLHNGGIPHYQHNLGGVSCSFLGRLLNLSKARISQLKKACPFIHCRHRYLPTEFTLFEVRHIRNDDPALGRKLVMRGGEIVQQVVDGFEWFGIELTFRSI